MRLSLILALAALLVGLAGCSSAALPAPLGCDRRPVNSPDTISGLTETGDHTPTLAPGRLLRRVENHLS